ncbi:hypothetical protein NN561_015888 [Cricetulus griseus]
MDETKRSPYTPPTGTQSLCALLTPTRPKPVEWTTECSAPAPESTCPTVGPQCARPPSKPEAEAGESFKRESSRYAAVPDTSEGSGAPARGEEAQHTRMHRPNATIPMPQSHQELRCRRAPALDAQPRRCVLVAAQTERLSPDPVNLLPRKSSAKHKTMCWSSVQDIRMVTHLLAEARDEKDGGTRESG